MLEDGRGVKCFGEYLPGDEVTKRLNSVWAQLAFEAEILPYFLGIACGATVFVGVCYVSSLTMRQPGTAESVVMQMLLWHAT